MTHLSPYTKKCELVPGILLKTSSWLVLGYKNKILGQFPELKHEGEHVKP